MPCSVRRKVGQKENKLINEQRRGTFNLGGQKVKRSGADKSRKLKVVCKVGYGSKGKVNAFLYYSLCFPLNFANQITRYEDLLRRSAIMYSFVLLLLLLTCHDKGVLAHHTYRKATVYILFLQCNQVILLQAQ